MIIWAILISIAILVLMVIFVTRPLYKTEPMAEDKAVNGAKLLAFEYQQTLNRIRDLEQEHLEGKTSEEDYHQRRELLTREAAEALQQLDADKLAKGVNSEK